MTVVVGFGECLRRGASAGRGNLSTGRCNLLGRWTHIEIKVPIHFVGIRGPVPRPQAAGVIVNNVGKEAEANVRFDARALNLLVAAERKDVVADEIRFAVVLMKAAVGSAINQVALGQNAAGAFVEIDSPAAVTVARDVMPQIVHNPGA